ncbi:tail tape measure protein [Sphingomonas hylomeconis]|uniref:Tail tape measure protein n=1 Tax=Sphingomonas hylomeconis TaxID=1395958 RepID=A0ABV7SZI1_9SPHN|nr:tail tape measure protein [Sphingomonas hylomeconis]
MDEEIERLVISVRADTQGFARDVGEMRASLDGPLQAGADRAGQAIERGLLSAVRSGKIGFEELRGVALSVLGEIAAAAVQGGLQSLFGGGGGGSGGANGLLSLATSLFAGAPGRATGGPVSPGRAYRVGERGPELFVPTGAGRVEAAGGGGVREVRVSIAVHARDGEAPATLARSSRQVARAVRAALEAE